MAISPTLRITFRECRQQACRLFCSIRPRKTKPIPSWMYFPARPPAEAPPSTSLAQIAPRPRYATADTAISAGQHETGDSVPLSFTAVYDRSRGELLTDDAEVRKGTGTVPAGQRTAGTQTSASGVGGHEPRLRSIAALAWCHQKSRQSLAVLSRFSTGLEWPSGTGPGFAR